MHQIYKRIPMPKCDFNKVAHNEEKFRPWLADDDKFLKKHWLKHPKVVSKKPEIDIIRFFLNFRFFSRKSQRQQKLAKKQKRSHISQYSFAQKLQSFYETQLT